MSKLIVVTGGYGFIGSRFVKYIIENTDYTVAIIDKKTYAADNNRIFSWFDQYKHESRIMHFIEDISNPQLNNNTWYILHKAHYIVNFAAETHVDNSIKDGSPFIKSNIEGVYNLLESCKNSSKLIKFIQISTDEVYGDMEQIPNSEKGADESYQLRPSSYYSASKAAADHLVQACSHTFGIKYIITRTCNNYGPYQHPEKFLPKMIQKALNKEPIPLYGLGDQVREWIHVDENVETIFKLMESPEVNQVFNIGSGVRHKNIDIIRLVEHLLGKQVIYEHVKDRLGHDKAYRLNSEKVQKLLGNSQTKYPNLEEFLSGCI